MGIPLSGISLPGLSAVFSTLASLLPHWPDESALGLNVGLDPAKAGLSAFYAHGDDQLNLGMMYGLPGRVQNQTDIRVGVMYNRRVTDWGLFVATGIHASYIVESRPEKDEIPEETQPGNAHGVTWQSRGLRSPEWMFAIGEDFWFGKKDRYGMYADLAAGYALPTSTVDKWQVYVGAGVSYRFRVN